MCGIIGIVGKNAVQERLVQGLSRLEYRGYDSAGIATVHEGRLSRRRNPGKLVNLKTLLATDSLEGHTGIGHIRWATHGQPTETNSHPHTSKSVTLVHNGIIENHEELRQKLEAQGYHHETQTDSEVVAHLVQSYLDQGKQPLDAAQSAIQELVGAYALAMIFEGHDNMMIATRKGAPLAVGYGEGEMYIGSDSLGLSDLSKKLCYLDEGDLAYLTPTECVIYNEQGQKVERAITSLDSQDQSVSKDGYDHFMLKEIYEQPDVIQRTLSSFMTEDHTGLKLPPLPFNPKELSKVTIIACGTSYYAGMVAKYWIEEYARLPVEVDLASEFRYRNPPLDPNGVYLFISQSGETADTLAAHRYVKDNNGKTISIVNVTESSLARETDLLLTTLAGREIGVASTKAFITQLTVLLTLSVALGQERETLSQEQMTSLCKELARLPDFMRQALLLNQSIEKIASDLKSASDTLYLGRGSLYPIALEGALKLKEISYIHAEAYAAGEMKHGPIALIDENMPVVVLAPTDALFEKTASNMQEVMARDGKVILIGDQDGAGKLSESDLQTIILPKCPDALSPIVYTVPVQFLAYYTARKKGTDVDQPRNLAKSVTVE